MGDDKRDRHDEQALVLCQVPAESPRRSRAGGAITMSDATNAATAHQPSAYVVAGAPDT